jgi:HSP20 family molecular chaperone IbpA
MIATINSSRPVLARTVRCNPSASSIRLLVVRPVRAQSTTGEPHQRPAAAEQHDEEAKELQKQEQPSSSGPVVRPAYSVSRLPSILAEMQHEMDVLSRTFGMPRLWDDTEMLMHNFRPLNLMSDMAAATSQMPALRLATDIEESDKAFTIKADVPGM